MSRTVQQAISSTHPRDRAVRRCLTTHCRHKHGLTIPLIGVSVAMTATYGLDAKLRQDVLVNARRRNWVVSGPLVLVDTRSSRNRVKTSRVDSGSG